MACDKVEIDVSGHAIEYLDYFENSKKFIKNYEISKDGNNLSFDDYQYEKLDYSSIKKEIENTRNSLAADDRDKRVYGLRIFYTLDVINNKIKLYYFVDYTKPYTDVDDKGEFFFEYLNTDYKTIIDYLNNSNLTVYESDKGQLKPLGQTQKELALRQWEDYKEKISIRTYIPIQSRNFDPEKDPVSSFFPESVFLGLEAAEENQKHVFLVSVCKNYSASHIHSIELGNILPPFDENAISQVTPGEIAKFRGRAANYGQLCPNNCKGFNTKKTQDICKFTIIKQVHNN